MLQIGCLRNSQGCGGVDLLLHACAQTKLSVVKLDDSEHLISGRGVPRSIEGEKKSDSQ